MVGIGLGVLWIGYTAFAFGRALTKGAQVTFTDMVLPSHRTYALHQITNASLPGSSGGTPGVPGASGQTPIGPTSTTEQVGGAGLASAGVGQVATATKGGSQSGAAGLWDTFLQGIGLG